MPTVGDLQRERALRLLRQGYASGNLTAAALENRCERALQASSSLELCWSVRGLPGAVTEVALATTVEPVVRRHQRAVTSAAARVLGWLAAAAWIALSAALLLAFAVWSLVSGMPLATAGAFGLIWVALSAPPALVVFRTRRHRRP